MFSIETERLKLSEFEIKDGSFVLKLLNTKGWLQFIGDRKVRNLEDAESYILNKISLSYRTNGFGFYLAQLKSTGEPIGMCGLVKRQELDEVDLGFAFLPEYLRKGYALEASNACLKLAKETLGIKTLIAITLPDNLPSINLLKKLNFNFEAKIKMKEEKDKLLLFKIELS